MQMANNSGKRRVLICGGGNGAQCLSVLAESRDNFEVHVLTLFQDEADRWQNVLKDTQMKLSVVNPNGSENDIYASPLFVTKDPKLAMAGVNIIILVVPAFAHEQYLTAIAPHLQANSVIVGLPGQAGFEFQCRGILGDAVSSCIIASTESLPFACRISEFGKHVRLLGFKETLAISYIKGKRCQLQFSVTEIIQEIIGPKPNLRELQNYLAVTFLAISALHPAMMYGKWKDWDGKPVKEPPLFYQGVDETQAKLVSDASDEKLKIAKKIEEVRKGTDMSDVIGDFDWFKLTYTDQIKDKTSILTTMRTNKAYDGIVFPMLQVDGGYVPNFKHRYLTEDLPFGIVVLKGIAEIVGVETPVHDEIIKWGQEKIGKEYIVGSKMTGVDARSSRAPQSFGIHTVDDLFTL